MSDFKEQREQAELRILESAVRAATGDLRNKISAQAEAFRKVILERDALVNRIKTLRAGISGGSDTGGVFWREILIAADDVLAQWHEDLTLDCIHPGYCCVCGHTGKCPEDGPSLVSNIRD